MFRLECGVEPPHSKRGLVSSIYSYRIISSPVTRLAGGNGMRAKQGMALGLLFAVLVSFSPSVVFGQPVNPTPPTQAPVATPDPKELSASERLSQPYLIKFNNIQLVELLRFLSGITGKNFIFDEEELNFRVTIVSEEPTSVSNIMAALLQVLRIRGLSMLEQGNNIVIHTNPNTKRLGHLKGEGIDASNDVETEMVTQVYRLLNIKTEDVQTLIKTLISSQAQIEALPETNHVVVTDFAANIDRITLLIDRLDSSRPTLEIGQYLVKNAPVQALADLLTNVLEPIAGSQTLQITASPGTNSIFVVSTPYLVEKSLSVLQTLDQTNRQTRIMSLDRMQLMPEGPQTPLLTPEERERLTRDATTLREQILGGGTSSRQAIESERAKLLGELALGNLNEDQARLVKNRIELLNKMLELSENGRNAIEQMDQARAQLDMRRQELEKLLAGELKPEEREKIVAEHAAILEQIARVDADRKAVEGESSRRLEAVANQLRDLIENPPPPVTLDIRKDSRPQGPGELTSELPDIVRTTQHVIYKLQYRRTDEAISALQSIGAALQDSGDPNRELVDCIRTAQAIDSTNSIVLSGIPEAVQGAVDLLKAVDISRRQVFLELLILQTTISNSLDFGVEWGARYQDSPNVGGSAGFAVGPALPAAIQSTVEGAVDGPDMKSIAATPGSHLGIVGKVIKMGQTSFFSLGGLVKALEKDADTDVLVNAKLIVEDGSPAETFAGQNERFKGQTVTTPGSTNTTTNYEYRDVGSTFRVTPFIGEGNWITLEINQEYSKDSGDPLTRSKEDLDLGPVTQVTRTTTRVHVPNHYFLVLSGMVQQSRNVENTGLPCLGTLPVIGALFGSRGRSSSLQNLLLFIRPTIVDTMDEMADLTRDQYRLFQKRAKHNPPGAGPEDYDIDMGLDFLR